MGVLPSPLAGSLLVAAVWLLVAVAGLVPAGNAAFARRFAFPLGALAGVALAALGLQAVWLPPQSMTLPLGLPDLPFHLRIDPLAGFFLMLLGSVSAGISLYAAGYFREEPSGRLALIALQYHVFLASMAFVLLADDAYLFMVAWETMALSSYFLVITDHRKPAIRSAGFLYLLIAHLGAIAILLCFGVLHGGHGDYTFDALRAAQLQPAWATVAFLLAFFGFGAKAGMLPLHAWLPEAHPAAPSPVSALMSGIMIKTAIYGMVRVIFDLIGNVRWEWGMVVLVVGAATTLFGVLYALMQHDLKRLLAYHSVENIGIILLGLGMSIVFIGFGHPAAGVLALIAALYHTLNHAVFKGLLFLGAGSILHSTGLRNLNDMGGLIRGMPKTAFYFLIGGRAHRDVLRQGLRHRLPRSTARAGRSFAPAARRRCGQDGALRNGLARRRLLRARALPDIVSPGPESRRRLADRARAVRAGARRLGLAVAGADLRRSGELLARHLSRGHRGRNPAHVPAGAALLPRPRALRRSMGLRLSRADFANAGHRGCFRSADPPRVRTDLPHRTPAARSRRYRAPIYAQGRGPPLVLAVPAGCAGRRIRLLEDRAPAAGPDQHLPALQLHHPDCAPGVRAMNSAQGIAFQILQSVFVVLAAPLLTGWVNQCRAWLQNRSAPSILLPYFTLAKLFHKDAVFARDASPIFRWTPYILFGCMWLAAGIVPVLATGLPFAPAADIIALVGVFALARMFSALAAMDVGTSFGGLGARREMLIGFLAEPAMLMTLFTAAFISGSTQLTTIVDTLAHREFALYPSLAFAAVAFLMVLLAENARIPIDNPATHLELTMVHEALILEYSARHLALIEWAVAIKLFAYMTIGIALFVPWGIANAGDWSALPYAFAALAGNLALAGAGLALIETLLAKLRLFLAPEFLSTAFLLAVLGMLTHFLVKG